MTEMVTVKDAAERFNVSPQTLRNWCKEGRIPGAEQHGRYWKVPASALPEAPLKPAGPDTSALAPQSDAEIGALFPETHPGPRGGEKIYPHPAQENTEDWDNYQEPEGTWDVGPVTVASPFDVPTEATEAEPTLEEVRSRLGQMRTVVSELGSLAGQVYEAIGLAQAQVEMIERSQRGNGVVDFESLPDDAPDLIEAALAATHGRVPAADPDAAAINDLLAGNTVPLDVLSDPISIAEPEREIDTDPREPWELPEIDPRENWENTSHE